MLRYFLFYSYHNIVNQSINQSINQYRLQTTMACIIINVCTETYKYATADYHSITHLFNQSIKALSTVSARPCTRIHVHALQCVPMRLLVQLICTKSAHTYFAVGTTYTFCQFSVILTQTLKSVCSGIVSKLNFKLFP